jgi:uncharacterized membrane protein
MRLAILILGLAIFIGTHLFVSLRAQREKLIARIGAGPYKGVFSLVSILGLVLVVYGFSLYRREGLIPVWSPPDFLRHVTDALMWPAFVFVAAAYLPGHIKKALQHPMLAGVKVWAFAHLLSNGDLGGIVLFGSILGWAIYDRISLKHRAAAGARPGGEADLLPVPPPPRDKDTVDGGWKIDAVAVVVGTLVYLAVGFVFHPLAGVPVFVQ